MAERSTYTVGQIEARACEEVNRFLQRTVGRGAADVSATFAKDALFVHLRDVLTHAERSLAAASGADAPRNEAMVREMRDLLVRRSREELSAVLAVIVGRESVAVLHDLDAATGHEVIAFLFRRKASGA